MARLRAENQELDQSLELMDQESEAQDVAMTQTLQNLKDTQHRALLLQAQAGAVRRQQRGLQDPMQRLQNQLKHLQDMQRWGSASPRRLDILLRNPCVLPDPFLSES